VGWWKPTIVPSVGVRRSLSGVTPCCHDHSNDSSVFSGNASPAPRWAWIWKGAGSLAWEVAAVTVHAMKQATTNRQNSSLREFLDRNADIADAFYASCQPTDWPS